MKTTTAALSLVLSLAFLAQLRPAAADDACVGSPEWGQAPDFWTVPPAGAIGQLKARYDGRWAGAAQVPLDAGTNAGRVRLLQPGDGHLYVAFEIDATAENREVFWFGFAANGATDSLGATLLEVSVAPDPNPPTPPPPPPAELRLVQQEAIHCGATACPAGETCTGSVCPAITAGNIVTYRVLRGVARDSTNSVSVFKWDGPAFDATVAAKAWMEPASGPGPRAWHGPLYPAASPLGQPTGATVMLRIPDSTFGGAAASDFKMWVSAAKCTFLGAGPVFCAQQGNWPTAGAVVETTTDTYSAPDLPDWGTVHRVSACPSMAVLTAAGVQNETAGYDAAKPFTWPQIIHLDDNNDPSDDPPNWFAGRITLPSASSAASYRARFLVADWGSQIGNLDGSQWFEIGGVNNPGAAAGTEHLVFQWPPPGQTAAWHKDLACKYSNCTSSVAGCPYPTDTMAASCPAGSRLHHPHQCTQIRLESVGPTGSIKFQQDSKIFNTDFVGASVFWRVATISTSGIDTEKPSPLAAPAEGRDIYIHVSASNLPRTSTSYPSEETVKRIELIAGAAGTPPPGKRPPPEALFARNLRESLGRRNNDDQFGKDQQVSTITRVRSLPMTTVRMIAPTLEFQVFYDTGRIMDSHPGSPQKWLAPMTGFGYVAEHIGEVKGWEWALDGAEPLGSDWFRIRVKDGQAARVRTRIQAVEETRMPPGNPVWPPGKGWINGAATPGSVKVTVKKGGCAVNGDDAGAATGVLVLAALAWIARRRRDRAC